MSVTHSRLAKFKKVKWLFGKEVEIPRDWEFLKFNTVVKTNPTTKIESLMVPYIPMDAVDTTNAHFNYFVKRKFADFSSLPKFQENDVLFASITPSTENGKTCIVENFSKKGLGSSELTVLRATAKVFPKYLYYYLKSHRIRQYAISQMMGTTGRQRVPDSVFKRDLFFELPSIVEQKKIASILSRVDACIEKTQIKIERLERFKKGLMQQLLAKGIGHTKFKKTQLRYPFIKLNLPMRWKIKSIMELSALKNDAVLTGPFGLMLHSSDYVEKGTPIILIKNIKNGKIDDRGIPKVSKKYVEILSKYRLKKGDMVFSRVGRVGSAALIGEEQNGWLISGQVLRIRFQNSKLNSYFVNYFIQSSLFIKSLIPELLGSTRDSINTKILQNLLIITPTLTEQNKIASILSGVDAYIQKNQEYKEKLEELKKGLMQNLLTGKIRVKV